MKYPPETVRKAAQLFAEGVSCSEIAEIIGVNKSTVARWQQTGKFSQNDEECQLYEAVLGKALSPEYGLYPYQIKFLTDQSRFRGVKKSRQIGFSYLLGLDALLNCIRTGENSILISASQEQADLIISNAVNHAERLCVPVASYTKSRITLPNGVKLLARPANYRTVQGFDGHIYFDEFAWAHNNKRLFETAAPVATRGERRITVCSTPFIAGDQFYNIMDGVGKFSTFSRHVITIDEAVEAGCPVNIAELQDLYDEETFNCFFRCKYFEEGTALIDFDTILRAQGECLNNLDNGILYGGLDIGRVRDTTEIVFVEYSDKVYIRIMESMKKTRFQEQKEVIRGYLNRFNVRSFNIDKTGIGMNIAEDMEYEFPRTANGVWFTPAEKEALALNLKELFDNDRIVIPHDKELAAQIYSIKRTTSSYGFRYDAERDSTGHADKFWALALACRNLGLPNRKIMKATIL